MQAEWSGLMNGGLKDSQVDTLNSTLQMFIQIVGNKFAKQEYTQPSFPLKILSKIVHVQHSKV